MDLVEKRGVELKEENTAIKSILAGFLIALVVILFWLKPEITGFFTVEDITSYSDEIDISASSYYEYNWVPEHNGTVSSIRIDGHVENMGSAQVYVLYNNQKYKIYDNLISEAGIGSITGLALLNQTESNESADETVNEDINETITNQTDDVNYSIAISLKYKSGTEHDIDDNGIESTSSMVDFTVENSVNNMDDSLICVKWGVYSEENLETNYVCYGNNSCCNQYGLESLSAGWNDVFYGYYGLLGATMNNKVYASVAYINKDGSLVSSDEEWIPMKFYYSSVRFEDYCLETCSVSFNESSYIIIVNASNTSITLDKINYDVAMDKDVSNIAPRLLKNVSDITINKGRSYTINLSGYFYDEDLLSYTYYSADNITAVINGSFAEIAPDKGFEGIRFMFFTANDSELVTVTNVFKIEAKAAEREESVNAAKVVINKPVKWLKKIKLGEAETEISFNLTEKAENITVIKVNEGVKEKVKEEKIKKPRKAKRASLVPEEVEMTVEEEAEELEIEYYTPGPVSTEEVIDSSRKTVVISSDIHYENISAYTFIEDEASANNVHLYWLVNGSKQEVGADKYDNNGNNLVDYIEWIVPSLSNQTYEVAITYDESTFGQGRFNLTYYNGSALVINDTGDNYTKLLLHFDGADGDTSAFDSSGKGHIVYFQGDAKINASNYKFGGSGLTLDGTGAYLNLSDSDDWDLDEDFTIDFWVKHNNPTGQEDYIVQYEDDDNRWYFYHNHESGMRFVVRSGGSNIVEIANVGEITDSDWHYIALVRNGNVYNLYKDGVSMGNTTDSDEDTFAGSLRIGIAGSLLHEINGSIDELRITKGTARWTGNFIPPSREYGTGAYESEVYDYGMSLIYENISWYEHFPYGQELPSNEAIETEYEIGNVNMTGNVLLFHFNNESAYGENDSLVYDFSGHCYDNETEILTDEGWKLFSELNKTEKVMTLNQKTREKEWETPMEWQEFDYDKEMYKIILEDGSDLLVSEKHKVYSSIEEKNDLVSFIVMDEVFKNQRISFNTKSQHKASYMHSFEMAHVPLKILEMRNGNNIHHSELCNLLLQSNKQSRILEPELLHNLFDVCDVNSHNDSHHLLNSSTVIALPEGILSIFFNFSTYSGFIGNSSTGCQSILSQNSSSSLDNSLVLINSSKILLLLDSSLATSDQFTHGKRSNLSLNLSSIGVIKLAIYNTPLACNFSNSSSLFLIPSFMTSGQLMSGCLSNFSLNSLDTDTVNLFIFNASEFTRMVQKSKIFDIPHNCSSKHKCVDIYKGFGFDKNLDKFSLQPVTDVYSDYLDGKEVYFLDSSNEPVKVKSISKENYSGKIYDVDVENDVVLVRRGSQAPNFGSGSGTEFWKNFDTEKVDLDLDLENTGELAALDCSNSASQNYQSSPQVAELRCLAHPDTEEVCEELITYGGIWSGNSNNGTAYLGAHYNLTDKKIGAGAFEFDGVDDYVKINDSKTLDINNSITLSAWVKPRTIGNMERVIDKWNSAATPFGYTLYMATTNSFGCSFAVNNPVGGGWWDTAGNNILSIGKWSHIACTFDGSDVKMYHDGVLLKTIANSNSENIGINNMNLTIGVSAYQNQYPFDGVIDEAAIWNRSLSEDEILNIYKRGALRLNLSVRSCNDAACSGESWTDIEDNSPQNLTISSNQYFQYKAELETDNTLYSPELFNATIGYVNVSEVEVTLNYPMNNNNSVNFSNAVFNCSVNSTVPDALANISLYSDYNGIWQLIETKSISGTSAAVNFTRDIYSDRGDFTDNSFKWNCLAYDNNGNSDWGDSNYTFSSWELGTFYNTNSTNSNVSLNNSLDNYTKLLMHFDGVNGYSTNNTLDDAGNHYFNFSGDAKYNTSEKQFGESSAYFDGTGDYLSIPDSADWDVAGSSGDYTIDFWVKHDDPTRTESYISQYEDTNNRWRLVHSGASGFSWGVYSGGSWISDTPVAGAITDTNWHHVAVVKNGNTYTVYKDGGSVTNNVSALTDTLTGDVRIGLSENNPSGTAFKGHIDELRISKGIARWTGNFTPPAREYPLYDVQGNYTSQVFDAGSAASFDNVSWSSDLTDGGQALDNNTKLLLHMDADASASDHSYTVNGNPKINASANSNVSKSAMQFDGTGDYLSIPDSDDWYLNDDFAIDMWIKFTNSNLEQRLLGQYVDATHFWRVEKRAYNDFENELRITWNEGSNFGDYRTGALTWENNTWYHIAITRSGSSFFMFRDGVSLDVTEFTALGEITNLASIFTVGIQGGSSALNGAIDEFRITKGTARWTSNFTPDTSPYEPDENTTLLLHFDGDESNSNHTITFNGDMDGNSSEYKFDGSYYFDGTGDYLSIPSSDDFGIGTGDFSVDFWVYFSAINQYQFLVGGDSNNEFDVYYTTDGGNKLNMLLDGANHFFSWNSAAATNTWYHITVTRNNAELRAFVDGVQIGSNITSTKDVSSTGLVIGRQFNGNYQFKGYIDELRISKGIARWTQNFDPPVRKYPFNRTDLTIQTRTSDDGSTWTNFTPIGGKDSYNVFLESFDDGDGFNTNDTTDETERHRMTFYGDAHYNATEKKFGDSAVYFDGTGDYISIPDSPDWDFGSDDFTIDYWFKSPSPSNFQIWNWDTAVAGNYFQSYISVAGALNWYVHSTTNGKAGDFTLSTGNLNADTWYHIAHVRRGGSWYLYLNGLLADSNTTVTEPLDDYATEFEIGGDSESGQYANGFIDELRISKGIVRWTSNFTPPQGPYSEPLTNPSGLINSSARYLQYKADFMTESSSYSPLLEWVNVGYTSAASDSCSCPVSGPWNIANGDICALSDVCDIGEEQARVQDGSLRILSGGRLRAGGLSFENSQQFSMEEGGGMAIKERD